jgi:hypothetical protein
MTATWIAANALSATEHSRQLRRAVVASTENTGSLLYSRRRRFARWRKTGDIPACTTLSLRCGSISEPSSAVWMLLGPRENSRPPSSSSALGTRVRAGWLTWHIPNKIAARAATPGSLWLLAEALLRPVFTSGDAAPVAAFRRQNQCRYYICPQFTRANLSTLRSVVNPA